MSTTPAHATTIGRSGVGRTAAFWGAALTLSLFLAASSVPSPLYVVYQGEFGFSNVTLTAIFAVYALALLVTLIVAGSLSDHLGRKPVLIGALLLQIVSMLAFAEVQGVGWLFFARATQGVATGLAMSSISAALLDLEPNPQKPIGPLVGVAAPLSGLATGAIAAGLLVEYAPAPMHLVYWILLALFTATLLFATQIPETVRPDGNWRRSLSPRISVPDHLRTPFAATIPCLIATWALGGLTLSLAPSIASRVLGESNHVVGSLPIFVIAAVSAAMSVRLRHTHARTTARAGLVALIAGVATVLVGVTTGSLVVFVLGAAIAGLGFGPSFAGAFRALASQAPERQRAALVSAILAVSYLAFSIPVVIAGAAANEFGLEGTTTVYGLALIALAAIALPLTSRLEDPDNSLPAPAPGV